MAATSDAGIPDSVACPMCGDGTVRFARQETFPFVGLISFSCKDCPYRGVLPTDDDSPLGLENEDSPIVYLLTHRRRSLAPPAAHRRSRTTSDPAIGHQR